MAIIFICWQNPLRIQRKSSNCLVSNVKSWDRTEVPDLVQVEPPKSRHTMSSCNLCADICPCRCPDHNTSGPESSTDQEPSINQCCQTQYIVSHLNFGGLFHSLQPWFFYWERTLVCGVWYVWSVALHPVYLCMYFVTNINKVNTRWECSWILKLLFQVKTKARKNHDGWKSYERARAKLLISIPSVNKYS